jgi:hypothetical protein
MFEKILDLQLFAEGGGDAPAAGEGGEGGGVTGQVPVGGKSTRASRNPLSNVRYGKQANSTPQEAQVEEPPQTDTRTPEERQSTFEAMIKGEYKDEFSRRTQQIIDQRFAQTKQMEEREAALKPVLDMLATKYGVDVTDAKALAAAIEQDDTYYEDEAMQKGLTVKQLKEFKRLERENAEFNRAKAERERQANAQRIYGEWQQQAEDAKRYYGDFDLRNEINGPQGQRFMRLLQSGVDVRTAYEVVHKDEIIGGAMRKTAQAVAEKTVNDIRARGMRPPENGGGSTAPGQIVKNDPSKFTRADREEIARRARRGEKVEL